MSRIGSSPADLALFFLLLAELPDALVHVGHELMEMQRRLRLTGEASKNRSISMVLPRPTSP